MKFIQEKNVHRIILILQMSPAQPANNLICGTSNLVSGYGKSNSEAWSREKKPSRSKQPVETKDTAATNDIVVAYQRLSVPKQSFIPFDVALA
jgi:hypothetical protein